METASSAPRVQTPKRSGVVVPHKAKWHQRLAAALVYGLIRCLAATIRFELEDPSGIFKGAPAEKIIFSIWHNRLALSLMMYRRYVVRFAPERRMAAMVSASRDGGMLARVLEHFSVQPVRGSSSRRGRHMPVWAGRRLPTSRSQRHLSATFTSFSRRPERTARPPSACSSIRW